MMPEWNAARKEMRRYYEEQNEQLKGFAAIPGVTLGPYYDANKLDLTIIPNPDQIVRVKVNKQTHEIGYEPENEHEVTVIVKPLKEQG